VVIWELVRNPPRMMYTTGAMLIPTNSQAIAYACQPARWRREDLRSFWLGGASVVVITSSVP